MSQAAKFEMYTYFNLCHILKVLVALLKDPSTDKVSSNARIFSQKDLSVLFQPIQYLAHILLEEAQCQSLVQLQFLGVPFGLKSAVLAQDFVDH